MSEDLLFRMLLILLWIVFAGTRIYYRSKRIAPQYKGEEQPKGKERLGGWAGIMLSIGILGMLASVILYLVAWPFVLGFQLPIPSIIRWFGVVVGFCSVPLLIWIHRALGKYYAAQLELKEEHQLITGGPYSRVRHPMYTIFILFTSSMGFITANLLVILFCLLVVFSFPFIARKEESMLVSLFGEEYKEYMRWTGRFFPRLRRQKQETRDCLK